MKCFTGIIKKIKNWFGKDKKKNNYPLYYIENQNIK